MTLESALKTFDFRGRLSGRAYYWLSFVSVMAWLLSAALLGFAINTIGWWATPLALPLILATLWRASQLVRRVHDLGYSGYWLLAAPISLVIGLAIYVQDGISIVVGHAFLALALTFWLLFTIMLQLRGTTGVNRFGPDPMAEDSRHNWR